MNEHTPMTKVEFIHSCSRGTHVSYDYAIVKDCITNVTYDYTLVKDCITNVTYDYTIVKDCNTNVTYDYKIVKDSRPIGSPIPRKSKSFMKT